MHAGLLGDRDEVAGQDQPALGMAPADQRLDAGDLLPPQVDLGLILQEQLVVVRSRDRARRRADRATSAAAAARRSCVIGAVGRRGPRRARVRPPRSAAPRRRRAPARGGAERERDAVLFAVDDRTAPRSAVTDRRDPAIEIALVARRRTQLSIGRARPATRHRASGSDRGDPRGDVVAPAASGRARPRWRRSAAKFGDLDQQLEAPGATAPDQRDDRGVFGARTPVSPDDGHGRSCAVG